MKLRWRQDFGSYVAKIGGIGSVRIAHHGSNYIVYLNDEDGRLEERIVSLDNGPAPSLERAQELAQRWADKNILEPGDIVWWEGGGYRKIDQVERDPLSDIVKEEKRIATLLGDGGYCFCTNHNIGWYELWNDDDALLGSFSSLHELEQSEWWERYVKDLDEIDRGGEE